MKTKKSNRLLSAVLAILMVFAVCPMFAISAGEPTGVPSTQAAVEYWDGTVPGLNGTTYAVVDNVLASTTMPAYVKAETPYYLSKAQFLEHFTLGDAKATNSRFYGITIKDEIGFAMFCLMTNNSFYIIDTDNGNTVWFNGARSTDSAKLDGIYYLWHQDAWITFGDDFYMNDPEADRSTWNSVVPLFWRKPSTTTSNDAYRMRINGGNHAIVGWYVKNNTSASSSTAAEANKTMNGYGLVGTWHGNYYGNTIQNVAMLNSAMDLTIESSSKSILCAGGLVGNMMGNIIMPADAGWYGAKNNTFTITNCVADVEINLTNNQTSFGYWWGGSNPQNAMIGGLIGSASIREMLSVDPWTSYTSGVVVLTMTNNLVNLSGTGSATGVPQARVGGLTSRITAGLTTLTITDNYVVTDLKGYDAASSFTYPAYMDATATTVTANSNWFYVIKNKADQSTTLHAGSLGDASNKVLTSTDVLDDTYFDAVKGTGFAAWTAVANQLPVPTALASNALVTANAKNAVIDLLKGMLAAGTVVEINSAGRLYNAFVAANKARAEDTEPAYGNFNFKLTANIDMTGYELPSISNIRSFDGQGYVISNLTINRVLKATDTMVGGLTDNLGNDGWGEIYAGTFKDVAFVNYTLNVDATACTSEYYVGGLFGYVGTNSVISNVYLQGDLKVNGTAVGDNGGRLGTFGAALKYNNGSLGATYNNCVFIGTASAPKAVAPFMEVIGYSNSDWAAIAKTSSTYTDKLEITNAARQIKINNCYSVCYEEDGNGNFGAWSPKVGDSVGMQALALTNAYQVGLKQDYKLHHVGSANGYENVVDASGNSLWYLDRFNVGDVANGNLIGAAAGGSTAAYTVEDFHGLEADNAMVFNNPTEWKFYADGMPVPAVFGANADTLSLKNLGSIMLGLKQTVFHGAQLRLDKAGIRFVAEFDVEKHLQIADGMTVEFGFLILPTTAITEQGRTLTYNGQDVLKISTRDANQLLAAGDPRLGDITVQNEGGKILLGVMTEIPDATLTSSKEFTVQPYVAYFDGEELVSYTAEGTNVQKFSGIYCANALCANPAVTEDVKKLVCEAFEGKEGFLYKWDATSESCRFVNWLINESTTILYSAPVAFSATNRTAYNAYYMEKNAVIVFQEELNKALRTSIPLADASTYSELGATIIEAKVVSYLDENQYRISVSDLTGNHVITVEGGHYAAMETGLDVLRAALIANNGIMQNDYYVLANTDVVTSGISSVFSAYGASVNNYKLVWNDEFNQSTLDYDRWCYDGSNPAKGVDDIALSNKATVDGDNLNINTVLKNGVYEETKLVTTFGTMNWNGGYLEMRGSIPYDAIGKWVSMWATTGNSSIFIKEWKAENGISGEGTWGLKPTDAPSAANNNAGNGMGIEVDMIELMASNKGAQTAVHIYPAEISGREQNEDGYDLGSAATALGYHTYGFFWNREYMAFTIDGAIHYTFHLKATGTDTTDKDYIDGVAKQYYAYGDFDPGKIALSLILQNDVFSPDYGALPSWPEETWSGIATEGAAYDHTFQIDYIRLYQTEGDMLYLPHEGVTKGVDAEGNFNWTF